MSLPTATDYQGAIQNPHQCFSDFELRFGSPVIGNWGLPKVTTGNFAAVFQIQSNERKYAVKCFTRYYPEQEERYATISHYLQTLKPPYMVDFRFLKKGVKVKSDWYPVVKMEWVEGDTLGAYVEKNLNNPTALRDLADKFLELTKDLRRHSIAHGDLQHGNILVVGNNLRLVDYDGVFVPGLQGKSATETGHPNYQHPDRDKHFGPFLDNFSVWVIYISLIALHADPGLRNRLALDEECLVFRKRDFSAPESSEALQALEQSPDPRVRTLALSFRPLIYTMDLAQLPALGDIPLVQVQPSLTTRPSLPRWITNHISSATSNETVQMPPRVVGSSWILDHLEPIALVSIKPSRRPERLVIALYVIGSIVILAGDWAVLSSLGNTWLSLTFVAIGSGLSIVSGLAGVASFLIVRYRSLPEVRKKKGLEKEIKSLHEQIKRLEGPKGLKRLYEDKSQLEKEEGKAVSASRIKQQENTQREKTEKDAIEASLRTKLARLRLRQTEIQSVEHSELTKALNDLQNDYLRKGLEQYALAKAVVPSIGPKIKQRLLFAGIRTAADVQVHIDVPGVGPKKTAVLLAWRQHLEMDLRSLMPQVLPVQLKEAIKAKYRAQMGALKSDEAKALQDTNRAKQAIGNKYQQEYTALSKSMQDTKNQYDLRRRELDQKITGAKLQLSEGHWVLSKKKREKESYQHISFGAYLRWVFLGL